MKDGIKFILVMAVSFVIFLTFFHFLFKHAYEDGYREGRLIIQERFAR